MLRTIATAGLAMISADRLQRLWHTLPERFLAALTGIRPSRGAPIFNGYTTRSQTLGTFGPASTNRQSTAGRSKRCRHDAFARRSRWDAPSAY